MSDWGFDFNDSKVDKKTNLYHVIFTGEENDSIYEDIRGCIVLGWASHVKCKSGGVGRLSGRAHTHELVASPAQFESRKRVYDRDYKRIIRAFYRSVPGSCQCTPQKERDTCKRCSPYGIKVKLIHGIPYFINSARYVLSIYQEVYKQLGFSMENVI